MKFNISSVIIVFTFLFISGCELINPDEKIPGYIYIKDFTFTCSLDAQGFPSSKITDAWVYANNEFIGAYELPATVPILASGETEIIIYAGIKENGISGTAMIYPFYNAYTITKTLTEGVTDTLTPATTYKNSAAITFLFRERFEVGNAFEEVYDDVEFTTTSDPSLVFEGTRSAIATFTDEMDTFWINTSDVLLFPGIDHLLFLEIDYRSDFSYNVFLKCNTTSGSAIYDEILTITPKDFWNKIYVNLNPSLQFFASYQPVSYNLEFRAANTTVDTGYILFDNIKIIQSN